MIKYIFSKSSFVLIFLISYLIGIFFGDLVKIDLWFFGGLIFALVVSFLFFKVLFWRLTIILIIGLLFGLFYYNLWLVKENQKIIVYNKKISLEILVSERPIVKGSGQSFVGEIETPGGNTKLQVELPRYPEVRFGDRLQANGIIEDPGKMPTVNNFNYGEYLLRHGIRGLVKNSQIEFLPLKSNFKISVYKTIYKISEAFEASLNRSLAEPYSSLQVGLILGARSNIPDSLMSAFNRTGTTHIVAVSGYNLAIIVSVLALINLLLSRRLSFYFLVGLVLIFVILTGASASVVRAAILALLVSLGKLEGRRINYTNLILLVAFLMLLANPNALKYDISFQLSFLAFAGVVYLADKIASCKIFTILPLWLKTILSQTLGAQIAVLPVILYNFGVLSIISPLANILILPVIPFAMFLGFVAGLLGIIWLKLGQIFALAAWLFLKYIFTVTTVLSNFDWAAVTINFKEWWWIPLYYILIIIWLNSGKTQCETI